MANEKKTTEKKYETNWYSRKFIIAVSLIVISILMMYFTDKVSFVQWGDFIKWVVGIYMTDNALSKFAQK